MTNEVVEDCPPSCTGVSCVRCLREQRKAVNKVEWKIQIRHKGKWMESCIHWYGNKPSLWELLEYFVTLRSAMGYDIRLLTPDGVVAAYR